LKEAILTAEQIYSNPDNSFHDVNEDIKNKLISDIEQFISTWFGYKPQSISAVFHNGGISVTMTGILSEAEKNVSRISGLAELIVKNHIGAFKTVRKIFEKQIEQILQRSVIGSSLLLDPESDCATILLQFENTKINRINIS
jgi:uncharacterized protein YbcI